VALVPGFVFSITKKIVLKMHPVILCRSLCGGQASTPAINAVAVAANGNVPVPGSTVLYRGQRAADAGRSGDRADRLGGAS
jgi:hypothetical protein